MSLIKDVFPETGDLADVFEPRRRGRAQRTVILEAAAREILEEIQPASVRAVCYQLFTRRLIPNMSKSATNSVSRLLRIAREQDVIPWEWIVDESRDAENLRAQWKDPEQIIRAAVEGYRRDYWQDQDYRVEVWSEKGTVRGTLGPVLREYGVTFRVMHGYGSATVLHDIAEQSISSTKPLAALYVGDWDPSGKHMSDVDLPRRLKEYGGNVALFRVALTAIHLLPDLPSFEPETKRKDPRHAWFMRNVNTQCYELDAMAPPDLREIVARRICSFLDLDKWDQAMHVEAAQIESMREFHKSWQASISSRGRS